ncbi:hypothetical protein [Hydrogenophaga atypica]|uniref:Uncharacterized protein n=1 Tax=Hydrogenophaga atypica TaxID=249409 RepID=A0ABW2QJA5_9BURK
MRWPRKIAERNAARDEFHHRNWDAEVVSTRPREIGADTSDLADTCS